MTASSVTRAANCSTSTTEDLWITPDAELLDDKIVVTFAVAAFGQGKARCPGNDAVPYTVDLGVPIGDRMLIDGACIDDGPAASTSWCIDDDGVRWP